MTILPWPPVGGTSISNGGGSIRVLSNGTVDIEPAPGTLLILGNGNPPPVSTAFGLLSVGNGSFAGSANGTLWALAASAGYTGSLIDAQIGAASILRVDASGAIIPIAPPATANRALFQIGNGPVDGTSAGHYTGSASGGGFGANFASGYAGDGIRLQVAGVDAFLVSLGAPVRVTLFGGIVNAGSGGFVEAGTGEFDVVSAFNPAGLVVFRQRGAGQTADSVQYQTSLSVILGGVRSDGLVYATTAALATKVKAGVPADADWAVAPPDGTIVGDSTDSKLYVRLGGTWKAVTVA